ncbi:aminoglycoside adenylyltransferase family protein [Aeromonas enteropelogenes]|uniref:aminoglycoside adenylyltransferase family protein n=1 Tax=Aeromonas enteropelogenes TaxID=29489 RepID=UPI0038D250AF
MNVPAEAKHALSIVQALLAKSLVAVYLHGSAVAGGLRPNSDVDLIVVIDQPMTSEARRRLTSELMAISGQYPFDLAGRRPIEMIVFLRADLADIHYPARSEFIYGEWMREMFELGECAKSSYDPELTLVLAQARQEAISLTGPIASELLPVLPMSDIRRAISDLLPALVETLQGDERNVLLILARMWYTTVTGAFASKDFAADWASTQLPAEQAHLLVAAREAYLNGSDNDWRYCQRELQCTVQCLYEKILDNLQ